MAVENKTTIILPDGRAVEVLKPVIVSASRSTDIPAFYPDWFFKRLEIGYSVWTNPFNGIRSYISYEDTRFIVFWSKNPRPLLSYLDRLDERGIGCYIQYTVNDYEKEGYEPYVPPLFERIDTFKRLAERLGPDRVIWRNDPLMLTDMIGIDELLERMQRIGDALQGYTGKLVFSFADLSCYARVVKNLNNSRVRYIEWEPDLMKETAREISKLNSRWGYSLATCAEQIELDCYGIRHNHCIDEELIVRLAYMDDKLMHHLGVQFGHAQETLWGFESPPAGSIDLGNGCYAVLTGKNRDRGQRRCCGCIRSKDIGQYNTCRHLCVYCYANAGKRTVLANHEAHLRSKDAESITGGRS